MSAFTHLDNQSLTQLVDWYGLVADQYTAATEGIENSNFFVQTKDTGGRTGHYVLTIFETLSSPQLCWFIELLNQLEQSGLPVAAPIRGPDGVMTRYRDKPVMLMPRLQGDHPLDPSETQCAALGAVLAQLHNTHLELPQPTHAEPLQQLRALTRDRLPQLPRATQDQAQQLLQRWQALALPEVLCHGDLFRDNALFQGSELSGVLDFYNAGRAPAVYDIAICLNDWCVDDQGNLRQAQTRGLLDRYQAERPLTTEEREALPLACAIAALRFWLSRLQPAGHVVAGRGAKNPDEFARLFRKRITDLQPGCHIGLF